MREREVWAKGKQASYGSRSCKLWDTSSDLELCGTVSINGERRKVYAGTIYHKSPIKDYPTTEIIFDDVVHYCQKIWLLID